MSAEVLREAAAAIREEWDDSGPRPMGTAWHQERDFHLAVAGWLDATARELDALGNPDLTAHPQDGRRSAALPVARAYLGAGQ